MHVHFTGKWALMATSPGTKNPEDEVEFVSEGPLRPVLEYIDLLSDGDDEEAKAAPQSMEDQIDRKKAQVASTLDRLAQQVAAEKQQRAEKCRAFKEKMVSQQAKGRQEVAFSVSNGDHFDAKRCVDMWLKMPELKPGTLSSHSRWGRRSSPHPSSHASVRTCPVINCGRVYDSAPLLEGHLKRFDHSPCDPTILLRGSPSAFYACVACCSHFESKEAWQAHLTAKLSSPDPGGHVHSLKYQLIQCFACPSCYLLFNIRDECLQHMAAKNHFIRPTGSAQTGRAAPLPIPWYAKTRLIILCKEVAFRVRCSACRKVLASHTEAQAHFNVRCRQASAMAEADQTVADIMKRLRVRGRCMPCDEVFCSEAQIERHRQGTGHQVVPLSTEEESILHYCSHHEVARMREAPPRPCPDSTGPRTSSKKRGMPNDPQDSSPVKRQRVRRPGAVLGTSGRQRPNAWFCECGLRFPEESAASRHIMLSNQVFHKCGVCGKLMCEASITRLHMSRIHGGAHLSHFQFWCRRCQVDMPREADVMSHVGETHHGHTFYREREVTEEEEEEGESSTLDPRKCSPIVDVAPADRPPKWLCRMCEELFESLEAVRRHCGAVASHSFQRFLCGHCSQRFFKELTLRRHCDAEHAGHIDMRWCCGLCDSMRLETEDEFLQHYRSLHAEDYCRVEDPPTRPRAAPSPLSQTCPCMGTEKDKAERNATFTRCMKRLASEGCCHYSCITCGMRTPSYVQIKVHVQEDHGVHKRDKSFEVACGLCPQSLAGVPAFHSHYHAQHCPLCPRERHRDDKMDTKAAVPLMLKAEELAPKDNEEIEDIKRAIALSSGEAEWRSPPSGDESEEDLNHALALSAEEMQRKRTESDEGR
uniref:Zinc finger protein 451 n=1 Tax=Paramormyrops kingsleyae TaxID=1676925 RepID=A0A3B3QTA3_9TELE